jgi:hypothetical protein
MNVEFISSPLLSHLKKGIEQLCHEPGTSAIMLLAADSNNADEEEFSALLKTITVPVFGGIFPGLIYGGGKKEQGYILVRMCQPVDIEIVHGISSSAFEQQLYGLGQRCSGTAQSLFVFVDGMSKLISAFIDSLFMYIGLDYNYIGAGCGSLSLKMKPCVITNSGLMQDAAIIAGAAMPSGIGVSHGWESIAGSFTATSTEGTLLAELDYKPAIEVYREIVENHSGRKITEHNFFDISKSYPFGILKLDSEKIVRDPIALLDEGKLLCVGEISEGSFLHILNGNEEALIEAASAASQTALAAFAGKPEQFVFLVDCISRVLFLENSFYKEVDAVSSKYPGLPFFGILSLGEIANNKTDYLEFYNKTSVVACF